MLILLITIDYTKLFKWAVFRACDLMSSLKMRENMLKV